MSRRSSPLDLTTTLRQVRDPVIAVECRTCGRQGTLDRAALVKKHGANVTFARLRRAAAMGCDQLVSGDGDQCGARFPCLER
jgi:2-methylaconitate cis-trans-isomerase PrpF